MPDTEENQKAFPQSALSQNSGSSSGIPGVTRPFQ
jgi:hypothetical protein